jgi:hypothetical protein
MVTRANQPQTEEDIAKRFGLPNELAAFYARHGAFFEQARMFRDNVIHRGSSVETIFSTERGFAVQESLQPFARFGVWSDGHKLPNGLCSLRPAIGHVVKSTLDACEDFTQTIESIIQFPTETAPGFRLYLRGFFGDHLRDNAAAVRDCLWWDQVKRR